MVILHWQQFGLSRRHPLPAADVAQFGDVAVVVGQRVGESVAAGAVGDEVKLVGRRRVEHRLDGGPARIADGGGRQAVDQIGVEGVGVRRSAWLKGRFNAPLASANP